MHCEKNDLKERCCCKIRAGKEPSQRNMGSTILQAIQHVDCYKNRTTKQKNG
jgi:hypothetical protein